VTTRSPGTALGLTRQIGRNTVNGEPATKNSASRVAHGSLLLGIPVLVPCDAAKSSLPGRAWLSLLVA
jgi:hypothetical protein